MKTSLRHWLLRIGPLLAVSIVVIAAPTSLSRDCFWIGLSLCAAAVVLVLLDHWTQQRPKRSPWLALTWLAILAMVVNPSCNSLVREINLAREMGQAELSLRQMSLALTLYRGNHSDREPATLFELIASSDDAVQAATDESPRRAQLRAIVKDRRESELDRLVAANVLNVYLDKDAQGRVALRSRPISTGAVGWIAGDGPIAWLPQGQRLSGPAWSTRMPGDGPAK